MAAVWEAVVIAKSEVDRQGVIEITYEVQVDEEVVYPNMVYRGSPLLADVVASVQATVGELKKKVLDGDKIQIGSKITIA